MPELLRSPPLLGGVLIGGASRRMGRPKQLLEIASRSFAERVVDVLAPRVREVVLLGAGEVPASLSSLARLLDAPGVAGPLAGILAAVESRTEDAWLVVACDQPWLDGALLDWLIAQRTPGRDGVLPRADEGRVHPFPGVYEPALGPRLRALAVAGGSSLQPLGRDPKVFTPSVPEPLRASLRDVDRSEELSG